eukprot:g555.t1
MLRSGLSNRQVIPLLPCGLTTKTKWTEHVSLRTLETRGRVQKTREFGYCQASFFETLFGGSNSGSAATKEQANELVAELLEILTRNKPGNKPLTGPNERITEISTKLKSLNVTRNPARSTLLLGNYEALYTSRILGPPTAFNFRVAFNDDNKVVQSFEMMNLVLFPGTRKRFADFKPTGSSSYRLTFTGAERDKGPIDGKELVDYEEITSRNFDILHLDEQVLITVAEPNDQGERILTILIKKDVASKPQVDRAPQTEMNPKKGTTRRSLKITGATLAERKYKKEMEAQQAKTKANNAARETREGTVRLQREKAAAEREAALKLKAEIKESVDGFGLRLKEAQSNKKDAAATLKSFERENSDVLKEAIISRKKLDAFEAEIAGLSNEIEGMAEAERSSKNELK